MSIIVAYKKDDTVYMGTDTRVIIQDDKRNQLSPCNYKIQKLDNDILVGISGEYNERQTLFAYSEIFSLDKNGALTKKHIIKEIIPRLFEVLKMENLLNKDEALPYMKAKILLAHKDVLFEICSGFAVLQYKDFQAIGRNSSVIAYATLFNTKPTDDVNERIIKALALAQKHSHLVGSPFLLIDTKKLEYTLIGGDA